ncbi:MAG: Flp pilus assembly protein CpaB [Lysobacterales bacterium]|jgi:pilus assembly protein CpaB
MSLKEKLAVAGRSWGLLAAALVLGGLAFVGSSYYLESRERALSEELFSQLEEKRSVVVATMELAPGAVISPQNMAVANVPVSHLSASAIGPELFDNYAEKVLLAPMSPGEPLLHHFVAGDFAERFSDLLEPGERAVTLPIDEIKSNDGLLQLGDRVDLLLVAGGTDKASETELVPMVENVRVLATGRTTLATRSADLPSGDAEADLAMGYSTVTVGVTADQATQLLLAKDVGDLVVLLRNRSDTAALQATALSAERMLGGAREDAYDYFSGSQSESGSLVRSTRLVARPRDSERYPTSDPGPASEVNLEAPAETGAGAPEQRSGESAGDGR